MRLTYNVIFAASAFSIFYYLMVLFFAYGYYILGVQYGGHPDPNHGDGNDYERLTRMAGLFMYSYRTSIGDLEAPNAEYWKTINMSRHTDETSEDEKNQKG